MDAIRGRKSVCRSLFGLVDHEQLRLDLNLKLKEISEQDNRRWNFNFQTETPLPGRFQWEEVAAKSTDAFHRESTQVKDATCTTNTEDEDRLTSREYSAGTDQENCSHISNTHKCPVDVTHVQRKTSLSKTTGKTRNNTRITDFFAKRRRSSETKNIPNPFHTCSAEASLCKTIR